MKDIKPTRIENMYNRYRKVKLSVPYGARETGQKITKEKRKKEQKKKEQKKKRTEEKKKKKIKE